MSTNVGTLQAKLTLDISGFNRNMKSAVSSAQRLGSQLSSALRQSSQGFSSIASNAEATTSAMAGAVAQAQKFNGLTNQIASSTAKMAQQVAALNPFANMQSQVGSIDHNIDAIRGEVYSLNVALTNTNTILQQIATVLQNTANTSGATKAAQQFNQNMQQTASAAKQTASNTKQAGQAASKAGTNTTKMKQNLQSSALHAKDIKRILEGIVVSQVFYRILNVMQSIVSESVEFMQNMEQTELSFKYLLGNATAADALIEKLQDFAIASPLDMSGAADSTRYLLNMGFAAKNVVDVLSVITDAAVVSGQNVNETVHSISVALGQMLQSGTASAQEIRQLYNAGVPVAKILNQELGLTGKEVKNIGDLGIDSATVVSAILRGMQKQFAGASQEMQTTFRGAISVIKDSFYVLFNIVGQGLYENIRKKLIGISEAMQYLVNVARRLGPGGVFEALVPNKGWQAIFRNLIGACQQLGMAIQYLGKIVGTIFNAMGQEIAQVLNIILPPISIALNFIMKFIYGLLQACPAIKYFVAALTLIAIASTIGKILAWLWGVIGLGKICALVAGYVLNLAKALWALATINLVVTGIIAVITIVLALTGVLQKAINKVKELISLFGGKLANMAKSNKTINPSLNIGYDPNKILKPVANNQVKKNTDDYATSAENVANALDDVGAAADKAGKKTKQAFNQSFDEIFGINPNDESSALKDILGFDPADLDLTPLEDLQVDLGKLNDVPFDLGGSVDNFIVAWKQMIDDIIKWAKDNAGALAIALAGILGSLALGNPWLALAGTLVALFWDDLCNAFGIDVPNPAGISAAIGAGIGGVVGYLLGGKIGAYIGAAAGLLASTVFSIVFDRIAEAFNLGDYSKASSAIGQSIGICIGVAIGAVFGGPMGAAIGSSIGNLAGGLSGILWGSLKEKLGTSDLQGGSIIGTAVEGVISAGLADISTTTITAIAADAGIDIASCLKSGLISGIKGGLFTIATGFLTTALVSWIGKEIGKAQQDLDYAGIGGLLGGILGTIVGIAITIFTDGFGVLTIPIASSIGTAIGQGIGLFARDIGAWCGDAWNSVVTWLSNFNLVDTLNSAWSGLQTFLTVTVAGWFDIFSTTLSNFFTVSVPAALGKAGYAIGFALGIIAQAFITFFTVTIPAAFTATMTFFTTTLPAFFTLALTTISTFLTVTIPQVFVNCINTITTFFVNIGDTLTAFFTTTLPTLWASFVVIIKQLGINIIAGLIEGLQSAVVTVWTWITSFFNGFIQGFRDSFGIHSPAETMKPLGNNIIQGLLEGIRNAISSIASWISTNIWQPFKTAMCSFFNNTSSDIVNAGANVIQGLLNGMKSAMSNITSWLKDNVYDEIVDNIKSLFDINSPAKKMMPLGSYVTQGFGIGMSDAMGRVIQNVTTDMKDVISAFTLADNPLAKWSYDIWAAVNTNITKAINKIQELAMLTQAGIVLSASANGLGYGRTQYAQIQQSGKVNTQDFAEQTSNGIASTLGPIMANRSGTQSTNGTLRPLYVGTLIADDRSLRELDRRMQRITDEDKERKGQ